MKLAFVGTERECVGFKLAGAVTYPVKGEEEFKERIEKLLEEKDIGILVIADRFYSSFEPYKEKLKKRARPVVVFVPSFDGLHFKKSLKEFLYGVLGVKQL